MGVTIHRAAVAEDLEAVRGLCLEYAESTGVDLETQNLSAELAGLPGRYGPPAGCLLLARVDGRAAGCVAVKSLGAGVCEMKRLFVRPGFRKLGVGRMLVERVIAEARAIGYGVMRLDTLPAQMGSAVALYRAVGFRSIPAYWNNVLPGVDYMELTL